MLSVSSLSAYEYCKRKLFIEQVLGIKPEIPEEALTRGSIRHSIYEKINLAEKNIVKSIDKNDFEFVMRKYKDECLKILKKTIILNKERLRSIEIPLTNFFSELKPLIEFEAEFRAEKLFQFMSKNDFFGEELWENLTPKIKPEYRLSSEKLGLRGIIDELEVYNHFFVPVELKTGKVPDEGVWPGHKIQVAAYAMMLEDFFGVPVEKGVVRYLDTNTSRNVIINPFLKIVLHRPMLPIL